jgi:tetratricopeptide (TPR) repeat protein
MNRKERRAAIARNKAVAGSATLDVTELVGEATFAFRERRFAEAEVICQRVLAGAPGNAAVLNILGLIHQASGRHRPAVKSFAAAIAADDLDASCHYNIAFSYQTLEERDAAAAHFKKAIALGLNGRNVEQFLMNNPVVIEGVKRITDNEFIRRG